MLLLDVIHWYGKWLFDSSDSGTALTWLGAFPVTNGAENRDNYQYGCLPKPIVINAATGGRYGVSSNDAGASTPAKWGRVYAYTDGAGTAAPQDEFPCGEHIFKVNILEL